MEKFFGFIGLLRPPYMLENGDRDNIEKSQLYEVRVRRWRWMVFYSITGISSALIMHIALVCGYLPMFFPGFALASDQRATQSQVTAIRIEQLEARLFNLRKGQCDAIREGKSGLAYGQQIQPLARLYRELTGDTYRLAECSEL